LKLQSIGWREKADLTKLSYSKCDEGIAEVVDGILFMSKIISYILGLEERTPAKRSKNEREGQRDDVPAPIPLSRK
jgi:hypothetical protein